MGLFDKLKDKYSNSKLMKRDHLEAVCAFSALVMFAKPPVTDAEFDKAMNQLRVSEKLSAFDNNDKEQLLAQYCEQLRSGGRPARPLLRKQIQDMGSASHDDRLNITLIAIEVADDEEGIDPLELNMLRTIAKEDLGIDVDKLI